MVRSASHFVRAAVLAVSLAASLAAAAGPARACQSAGPSASPIPPTTAFRLWIKDPAVVAVRTALALAGQRPAPDTIPERYDLPLLEAVRAFQTRERLASTGMPGPDTIARLNALSQRASCAAPAPPPAAPPVPFGPPIPAGPPAVRLAAPASKPGRAVCVDVAPAPGDVAELPMVDAGAAQRLRATIARYEAVEARGGFTKVPPRQGYCRGLDHPAVAALIERLIEEGLLPESARGGRRFDDAVVAAVQKAQFDLGLLPTGRLGPEALAALNAPVAERLQALRASLPRVEAILARRELAGDPMRVLVNIPAAAVQALDPSGVVAGYRAIVGRDERETPEFVSTIPDVQVLPLWHAPKMIVERDLAPKQRANLAYLDEHGMRALRGGRPVDAAATDWTRAPFPDVVQRAGPDNALGPIRFGIGNGGSYFLHGTSNPALLKQSRDKRFLSSGCVRLEDPAQLAAILLRDVKAPDGAPWTLEKLREAIDANGDGWRAGPLVRLKKPVPVIWTYLTAWVTRDGRAHFRPDPYRRHAGA